MAIDNDVGLQDLQYIDLASVNNDVVIKHS